MESANFENKNIILKNLDKDTYEDSNKYNSEIKTSNKTSYDDTFYIKNEILDFNNTMVKTDFNQKNIFDYEITDLSVDYKRNRHKNLKHIKQIKSKENSFILNKNLDTEKKKEMNFIAENSENLNNIKNKNFEKISFKVKIIKIMNRKSDKILEILNTKDKMDCIIHLYSPNDVIYIFYFIRLRIK